MSDRRLQDFAVHVRTQWAHGRFNGWSLLALFAQGGADEVHTRLQGTLDVICLVSGLMLCCAIPMLLFPSPNLANLPLLAWQKQGFCFFTGLSIIICFMTIMLALLLLNGLNTSARRADKMWLLEHNGLLPTVIYTLFTIGAMSLSVGMACGMEPVYGLASSFTFASGAIFFCGVVPHLVNMHFILPRSHVIHGYLKKSRAECIAAATLALERLIAEDETDGVIESLAAAAAAAGDGGDSSPASSARTSAAGTLTFRHLDIKRSVAS